MTFTARPKKRKITYIYRKTGDCKEEIGKRGYHRMRRRKLFDQEVINLKLRL